MVDENNKDIDKFLKKDFLGNLTAHEVKILKAIFAMDPESTANLIGVEKSFDVFREQIQKIEVKALRKLRNGGGAGPGPGTL